MIFAESKEISTEQLLILLSYSTLFIIIDINSDGFNFLNFRI